RVRANRGRLLPRTVTAPFTDTRRGTLAAVLDALVPDDEHGPGALSAGVLGFVEDALDDALADLRPAYADGLDTLDALARSAHGCPFAALDAAGRDAMLAELEAGSHGAELRSFFELVRLHAVHG